VFVPEIFIGGITLKNTNFHIVPPEKRNSLNKLAELTIVAIRLINENPPFSFSDKQLSVTIMIILS